MFEIFDFGIFVGLENFGKYIFEKLDSSRDFLGYSICFLEIFMARKFNWAWDMNFLK